VTAFKALKLLDRKAHGPVSVDDGADISKGSSPAQKPVIDAEVFGRLEIVQLGRERDGHRSGPRFIAGLGFHNMRWCLALIVRQATSRHFSGNPGGSNAAGIPTCSFPRSGFGEPGAPRGARAPKRSRVYVRYSCVG
jgi:hypothetical protein